MRQQREEEMADLEAVHRQMLDAVPFNRVLGVRVVAVEAESVEVELPARPELLNHVGTMHAAAQFGLGESASGAMSVAAFGDLLAGGAVPLLAEARITYHRPASGTLRARATLARDEQQRIRADFAAAGKARYEMPVQLTDAGGTVTTTLQVNWVLLRPR